MKHQIVAEEKKRKHVPAPGDVLHRLRILRLEPLTVKHAVVNEVVPFDVSEVAKALVHGHTVVPVLDEVCVEGSQDQPGEDVGGPPLASGSGAPSSTATTSQDRTAADTVITMGRC